MYIAKSEAEKKRFADTLRREDHGNKLFKVSRPMKKTNQNVVREKWLFNTGFDWGKDKFPDDAPVEGPTMQIKIEWVVEVIRKMEIGKAAEVSAAVAETINASGYTGVELILL